MGNEDEGFNWGDTFVFWDIQDHPIPDGEACDVLKTARSALCEMGVYGNVTFRAYGDMKCMREDGYVGFNWIPAENEYQRRQKALVDTCGYIVRNRHKPLNLVLILGDISGNMDLVKAIHLLRSKGHCKVFLVQPPCGSGQLGSTDWLRAGLSAGEMLFTQIQTPDAITRTWMSRWLIEQ